MPIFNATEAIQAILSPAIMVSSSALFLLGLNARYGSTMTRIRLLNDEKRKLRAIQGNPPAEQPFCDIDRLLSVESQQNRLIRAAWYIHNSILCHILAAIFFVLTSCAIGLNFLVAGADALPLPLYFFMIGMVLILSGIIFLGVAIYTSYPAILLEVHNQH
jgi:hypothetical protein